MGALHGYGAGRDQEERAGRLTEPSVLDAEALQRLIGFGGPKLLRGMIDLFLNNAPVKVAEARAALDSGDTNALRDALHGLKSSAGQLGAITVFNACTDGEALAIAGDLQGCVKHVAIVETDYPIASRQLKAFGDAA